MRNKHGLVCIILGLVLILGAAGLSVHNVRDERQAGENAEQAYEQLRAEAIAPGEMELPEFILPAYQIDPRVEMPEIEIDGHSYIGYVSIPALEIDLPVMSELSMPNMKIAPCRYYGSIYLDNMVIAAHNYTQHFGRLGSVAIGDLVRFTDVDGNVFDYTVANLEQLNPGQTREMVLASDYDLTLFTCTISGMQRFTVRCIRVERWTGVRARALHRAIEAQAS